MRRPSRSPAVHQCEMDGVERHTPLVLKQQNSHPKHENRMYKFTCFWNRRYATKLCRMSFPSFRFNLSFETFCSLFLIEAAAEGSRLLFLQQIERCVWNSSQNENKLIKTK